MVLYFIAATTVAAIFPFPSALAAAKPVTCAIPKPCAVYENASTGPAVSASSVGGTGVLGSSGAGYTFYPGIDGESTNQTGNDAAGVFGLDYFTTGNLPAFGALGYGSTYGLYGETENAGTSPQAFGVGVDGLDNAGTSASDFNAGVLGRTTYGVGVLGEANGTPAAGLLGHGFPIGLYAVADSTNDGSQQNVDAVGIESESNGYALQARNTTYNTVVDLGPPGYFMEAYIPNSTFYAMTVDTHGDEVLSGTLTTAKGMYARTRGRTGTTRLAYGARTTAPQIEDVGDSQLTNGRAVVTLDTAFADTIDPRRAYHVFLTPDGDCKGLYVEKKSATAFVVRELQGGRSTLAFEYRIIAKPADDDAARLASAPQNEPARAAGSLPRRSRDVSEMPISAPLSPTERLRARLGPRGYAAMLATLHERRAGP